MLMLKMPHGLTDFSSRLVVWPVVLANNLLQQSWY